MVGKKKSFFLDLIIKVLHFILNISLISFISVSDHPPSGRKSLPDAHALLLIDEQRVCLHLQLVFQLGFLVDKTLQCVQCLVQPSAQNFNRFVDHVHFLN